MPTIVEPDENRIDQAVDIRTTLRESNTGLTQRDRKCVPIETNPILSLPFHSILVQRRSRCCHLNHDTAGEARCSPCRAARLGIDSTRKYRVSRPGARESPRDTLELGKLNHVVLELERKRTHGMASHGGPYESGPGQDLSATTMRH